MNIIKLPICCIFAFATLTLSQAQEAARPQVSPEQRFKQWDKNGDGKLTPDEVPGERLLKMLDKNGDGVVTMEEARAFGVGLAGQRQGPPGAVRGSPDPAPAATDGSQESRRPAVRRFGEVGRPAPSAGAQLPPAENFKPRAHGDEAQAAGLKPDVLARLDVEMQRHVSARNVAGVVAMIVRNSKVGQFEAYGFQDLEAGKPMPKDAIFRLQSMSKPVVTAGALTLHDEGRFTLDEPISKHLPEWREPKVQENGELVPARNPITPRMLMSHSSGLYYGTIEGGPFTGGAASRGARTTLAEHSTSLAAKPLKFHPGEGYSYGTSIDVLGRYIEVVSGKPLDEFLKERVFQPLQMVDTDFWVVPEKASRIAQLYSQPGPGQLQRGREPLQLTTKPTMFLGGQGLCSTVQDYERFCRMILSGGELDGARVLKAETVAMMFQNHLKGIGQKYGLGGAVDGEGSYSWGGANGTQFWIDRRNNLFAIFMVQTQNYRAPTYPAFRALVHEAAGIPLSRGGTIGEGAAVDGGRGISGLFRQRDKNGDGKLDRSEVPGPLFDRLDVNKDGFVTEDEVKTLWKNK